MDATDLANLDRDALIALIVKLLAEIEALKRSGKRQAAPFSTGTRPKDPKTPGRKPGQGVFKTREVPAAEPLSEPPVDVPVVEPECPRCGGEPGETRVERASITDLPEVVRPRVRLFRVAVRRGTRCGGRRPAVVTPNWPPTREERPPTDWALGCGPPPTGCITAWA